ncbi:hypothetical protein HaLaN_10520, partial [Haematococcus lacustris]
QPLFVSGPFPVTSLDSGGKQVLVFGPITGDGRTVTFTTCFEGAAGRLLSSTVPGPEFAHTTAILYTDSAPALNLVPRQRCCQLLCFSSRCPCCSCQCVLQGLPHGTLPSSCTRLQLLPASTPVEGQQVASNDDTPQYCSVSYRLSLLDTTLANNQLYYVVSGPQAGAGAGHRCCEEVGHCPSAAAMSTQGTGSTGKNVVDAIVWQGRGAKGSEGGYSPTVLKCTPALLLSPHLDSCPPALQMLQDFFTYNSLIANSTLLVGPPRVWSGAASIALGYVVYVYIHHLVHLRRARTYLVQPMWGSRSSVHA